MLKKETLKPTKLNILMALLALLLAVGGVLGFSLIARADSGPDEDETTDWVDWGAVAAQTIGVDVDALFDEWDQGKSLADVAKAHNVEPQQVTDAIVAAEKEQIAQLTANDKLSQDEAAEWLAELENEAAAFVKIEGCVDWFDVAAKTIGVEVDALFTALSKEQSIADVAKANNVEAQKVVAAIVTAEENWLKTQVANGALSQDEADEWLPDDNDLAEEARLFVEQAGDEGFFGDESAEFTNGVDWFDVAAKTIGVEVDALFNEMDAGKTIANVAQAHNVEAQKVVAAIVAAEKTWLDEQVANKAFSQKEADEWLSFLTEEAQTFIEMSAEAMLAPTP